MTANDQLDQLKRKYESVLSTIQQQQVQLSHVHVQDNKLLIQGAAPSEQAKNRVWDRIKQVDPNWAQDLTADITVNPGLAHSAGGNSGSGNQASQQSYTVQAGDTLSKISKQFYGRADAYMKIFEANRDILTDPNKINPGQSLKIPA